MVDLLVAGYVQMSAVRLHRRVGGPRKGERPWPAIGQIGSDASSCRAAWPWPGSACALAVGSRYAGQQPPKVPRIGYLTLTTTDAAEIAAFRDGLRELGYVEGQNIAIEVRRAESIEQFAALAAELVALPVDLILTSGGTASTQAAMGATRTIPIVFAAAPDPVRSGLVASLARPGGNVTGLSTLAPQAMGKRLQLLRELAPGVSRVMFLTQHGRCRGDRRASGGRAGRPVARGAAPGAEHRAPSRISRPRSRWPSSTMPRRSG